jgi:hypothetical protein
MPSTFSHTAQVAETLVSGLVELAEGNKTTLVSIDRPGLQTWSSSAADGVNPGQMEVIRNDSGAMFVL